MPVLLIVVTKKCTLDSYTIHAIYTNGIARIFSGGTPSDLSFDFSLLASLIRCF
jgi:hypothetical protein